MTLQRPASSQVFDRLGLNMLIANPNERNGQVFIASSTIHGLGLFAGEAIAAGQRVITYQGQWIQRKEVLRRRRFYDSIGFTCLMEFADGSAIDGLVGGNESRFINHCLEPNLGAEEEGSTMFFYALRNIASGEELTYDYGFDPKTAPE